MTEPRCQEEMKFIVQALQEYIETLKPTLQISLKTSLDKCINTILDDLQKPLKEEQ